MKDKPLPGTDSIPPMSTLMSGWTAATTDTIPPVRTQEVHNYFLYRKNPVTGKRRHFQRPLHKTDKFAKEDLVREIYINAITDESDYCYVRAKCCPSMKEKVQSESGQTTFYTIGVRLVKVTGRHWFLQLQGRDSWTLLPCGWTTPNISSHEGCMHLPAVPVE